MYTDGCMSSQGEGCSYLVKFSDDLLSFLQGSESDHGNALTDFISWCDDNFLDLNASKTKELIIDFRLDRNAAKECIMHNESVERVRCSYIIQISGYYFRCHSSTLSLNTRLS